MTEVAWNEFCRLYYKPAKKAADIHLARQRAKLGGFDKHVDEQYVVDAAVLSALEKAYAKYDSSRGVKITTFLSNIVHNELVDEIKKESKEASKQDSIDNLKTAVMGDSRDTSSGALEKMIPRLKKAILKLSPSDQIILNYYLENKSTYVARSAETLNIPQSYISVRRFRIFEKLPKLMEMSRMDYFKQCEEFECRDFEIYNRSILGGPDIIAISSESTSIEIAVSNPILPSLDYDKMARDVMKLIEAGI